MQRALRFRTLLENGRLGADEGEGEEHAGQERQDDVPVEEEPWAGKRSDQKKRHR